ncbi:conserved hypothetical protein [Burkholderiales bacterium 8X]|nr:conserved hypothetical protein [Burkholderiales bacterium 8X]
MESMTSEPASAAKAASIAAATPAEAEAQAASERPAPAIDVVEWTIEVGVASQSAEGTHYHADVYRQDEWLSRIAMSGAAASRAEAESLLADKCRDWIAAYENRERSGDTAFAVL